SSMNDSGCRADFLIAETSRILLQEVDQAALTLQRRHQNQTRCMQTLRRFGLLRPRRLELSNRLSDLGCECRVHDHSPRQFQPVPESDVLRHIENDSRIRVFLTRMKAQMYDPRKIVGLNRED